MFAAYFRNLIDQFGQGWNRFWYTPAHPLPLGVIRLLAGMIAIASLVSYTPDIDRFLSNTGMTPVNLVIDLDSATRENGEVVRPWRFSLLDKLSVRDLHVAHTISIGVLVAFTLGLFSRVTSILALLVWLSYLHRNPLVTQYHERILAFVMFYLALGPSGATLSLDRLIASRRGAASPTASWSANVSLRLMQIHLAIACFMMAISKLSIGATEWWSGMAIWWLSVQPGEPLVQIAWRNTSYHKFLINFWTHAIVFFELALPLVIWKPIARPILVPLGIVIWLSVIAVTGQVLFGLSLIAALLSFVPGEQMLALTSCCRGQQARPAASAR